MLLFKSYCQHSADNKGKKSFLGVIKAKKNVKVLVADRSKVGIIEIVVSAIKGAIISDLENVFHKIKP